MAKKIFLLILAVQMIALPLYAQDYNPLSKLSRGASNFALGWVEIPRQVIKVKQERGDGAGDIAGLFWGPVKGVAFFLGRTVVGVYEVVTFLIPTYKPLVEPEYIFSEEEEEF